MHMSVSYNQCTSFSRMALTTVNLYQSLLTKKSLTHNNFTCLLVPFTQSYRSKLLSSQFYVCIPSISDTGPYPPAYPRTTDTLCLTASSEAHVHRGHRAAIGSSAADLALPALLQGPAKGLQSRVQHHASGPIRFLGPRTTKMLCIRRNPG